MHMTLEFSMTPDDLHELTHAYLKISKESSRLSKRSPLHLIWILFAAALVVLIVFFRTVTFPGIPDPTTAENGLNTVGTIFLGSLAGGIILFNRRRRVSKRAMRKIFKDAPTYAERRRVLLGDEGITVATDTSSSLMSWSHFIRFYEMPGVFLLFDSSKSAHILPKRAFQASADIDSFRHFALANIGNRAFGFPVQPASVETNAETAT